MMFSHFGGPERDFEVSSKIWDFHDFIAKSLQKMDTGRLKTKAQQPSQHWYSLFYGQDAVKQPADRKHAVLQQIADFEFRIADFNDNHLI